MPIKKKVKVDVWAALASAKPSKNTKKKKMIVILHGKPSKGTSRAVKLDPKKTVVIEPIPKIKLGKITKTSKKYPSTWVDAFDRWKRGTAMATLKADVKSHGAQLQAAFIVMAGSREAFKALRTGGAGGQSLFGGKRAVGGGAARKAIVAAVDDTKVPHITAKERLAKWTSTWEHVHNTRIPIAIAPNGKRYVQARSTERADLLFDWPKDKWDYSAFGPTRMRLYETSSVIRKSKKHERLVEKGEKLLTVRKKNRKQRRVKKHALVKKGGR